MNVPDQATPALLATVRLSREILNGLRNEIQKIETSSGKSQPEAMGIVFGTSDSALVRLEGFKPAEFGEHESPQKAFDEFIAQAKLKPPGQSPLAGWYTIRAGDGGLLEKDIEFHNRHFHSAFDVALISRTDATGNVNFTLYTARSNGILSIQDHRRGSVRLQNSTPVSAPIDVPLADSANDKLYLDVYEAAKSLDRAEEREKWSTIPLSAFKLASKFGSKRAETEERAGNRETPDKAAKSPSPRQAVSTGPVLARPSTSATGSANPSPAQPQPRTGRNLQAQPYLPPPPQASSTSTPQTGFFRVVAWVLGTILVSIATYVGAHLYLKPELLKLAAQARAETATEARQPETPQASLRLKVSQDGTALELQWDPLSPIVQSAISGRLTVTEAGLIRQIDLDRDQLRTGRIIYTPSFGDVTFRLEVMDSVSHTFAESIRVLAAVSPGSLGANHQPSGKATVTRRHQRTVTPRSLGSQDLPLAASPIQSLQLSPPASKPEP